MLPLIIRVRVAVTVLYADFSISIDIVSVHDY